MYLSFCKISSGNSLLILLILLFVYSKQNVSNNFVYKKLPPSIKQCKFVTFSLLWIWSQWYGICCIQTRSKMCCSCPLICHFINFAFQYLFWNCWIVTVTISVVSNDFTSPKTRFFFGPLTWETSTVSLRLTILRVPPCSFFRTSVTLSFLSSSCSLLSLL